MLDNISQKISGLGQTAHTQIHTHTHTEKDYSINTFPLNHLPTQ